MEKTIYYEKRKNSDLFKSFEEEHLTYLSNSQNYIPIYSTFFQLNETNYNSINLNHSYYISKILENPESNNHIFL